MPRFRVLHLMRTWQRPSESFIINQMEFLRSFQPTVLSHRLYRGSSRWRGTHVLTTDLLGANRNRIDALLYTLARSMTPWAVQEIRKYIRGLSPDVIHIHFLVDAAFFTPALKDLGIPIVVSGYGFDVSEFPGEFYGLGRHYLLRSLRDARLYIAMSEDMKRDMVRLGLPEEKVRVHYHGLNSQRFRCEKREDVDSRPFRILVVGRLVPKKGHGVLLRALGILKRMGTPRQGFVLRVVGEGPLRDKLVRLASELGLGNQVQFVGHVPFTSDSLVLEYARADLFVLPSMCVARDKEGIPGTLLEAMSAGLPVVSTFHAGIPEIVENGKHGLLVREADENALADSLRLLMEDAGLRRRLADAAAARAAEQDVRILTPRLEAIYMSLLNSASATPGIAVQG